MPETRWVIVAPDGRFITLGRHSAPTEEELTTAEQQLRDRQLSGWLAIMHGNPYVGPLPYLEEVRPLANPTTPFAGGALACIEAIKKSRM